MLWAWTSNWIFLSTDPFIIHIRKCVNIERLFTEPWIRWQNNVYLGSHTHTHSELIFKENDAIYQSNCIRRNLGSYVIEQQTVIFNSEQRRKQNNNNNKNPRINSKWRQMWLICNEFLNVIKNRKQKFQAAINEFYVYRMDTGDRVIRLKKLICAICAFCFPFFLIRTESERSLYGLNKQLRYNNTLDNNWWFGWCFFFLVCFFLYLHWFWMAASWVHKISA